jgi:hypothetical protein
MAVSGGEVGNLVGWGDGKELPQWSKKDEDKKEGGKVEEEWEED